MTLFRGLVFPKIVVCVFSRKKESAALKTAGRVIFSLTLSPHLHWFLIF